MGDSAGMSAVLVLRAQTENSLRSNTMVRSCCLDGERCSVLGSVACDVSSLAHDFLPEALVVHMIFFRLGSSIPRSDG